MFNLMKTAILMAAITALFMLVGRWLGGQSWALVDGTAGSIHGGGDLGKARLYEGHRPSPSTTSAILRPARSC